MRHGGGKVIREYDPGPGVSVSTLAYEYTRDWNVPEHAHGSDQLIYASRGVMEVRSGQSVWLLPPHFGLWIPARTAHQIRMPEPVSMRTLYLRPGLARLGSNCRVLHTAPLLRELIFEIVRAGKLRSRNRTECALRDVLIAQLESARPVPTGVALPMDRRALAVAKAVLENPGAHGSLASLCDTAALSVRTLERVFRREVGMDFEKWRRQVRLMKAIEWMVAGSSVKEASSAVGYQQPTAFVTLFKATFGSTPKAWVSALDALS